MKNMFGGKTISIGLSDLIMHEHGFIARQGYAGIVLLLRSCPVSIPWSYFKATNPFLLTIVSPLVSQLSWTHFTALMSLPSSEDRWLSERKILEGNDEND